MSKRVRVNPLFLSTSNAILFCIVIFIFLIAPFFVDKFSNLTVKSCYLATPTRGGDYGFISRETFDKKGAVDVLILGSSFMWTGVNAEIIKNEIDRKAKIDSNVINFGTNWKSMALLYRLFKDISDNRKVKMLMIPALTLSEVKKEQMHILSKYWLPFDLIMENKKEFNIDFLIKSYAIKLLGLPRQLLSLVRNDFNENTFDTSKYGSYLVPAGYYGRPFFKKEYEAPHIKPSELLKGISHHDLVSRKSELKDSSRVAFIKLILQLAERKGTRVIFLKPKQCPSDKGGADETVFIPAAFKKKVHVISLNDNELYPSLSKTEVENMYYNKNHLNSNGNKYFTKTILPAIMEIYENI